MHQQVTCPSCSKRFRVPAHYVGRRVKCSKCEATFRIASPPQVEPETALPVEHDEMQVPPINEFDEPAPKKRRISTVIAFVMLGITVLFPIAVVALIVLGSVSEASEHRNARSGSSDFMGGSIVATENGTFEYKSRSQQKAERAGTMMGCLLYTSPSPRDRTRSRMPSSA